MGIVDLVAQRSTCIRRQVGAVIVKDKNILATGYNGAPRGLAHCMDVGCIRDQLSVPSGEKHELCRGLHAEQNAIIQAAYHGVGISGATIYTATYPCIICAKMIINAGITRVVYRQAYNDRLSQELLQEARIIVERFAPDGQPGGS
ncbi:MAG: cytidine/deoxycytidylate deaminase family protein [Deltaproteobacteria bacterium]|nr:cytidine/deoxycytidylate deaminase family protein [Candidatus Zymogenaceae bacterium]